MRRALVGYVSRGRSHIEVGNLLSEIILSQNLSPLSTSPLLAGGISSSLVPIAKFASPPSDFDEVFTRYYLQAEARRLLRARAENDKDERVCDCLRKIVPGAGGVAVMFSTKLQRAHYKNLLICGRVWQCPICARRISEGRRVELSQGLVSWRARGGTALLLGYTLRHGSDDDLKPLLANLLEAHRSTKAGAPFQRVKSRFGWAGSVRSLEVTHGQNGWHPHLHELVFIDGDLRASAKFDDFVAGQKERWLAALSKHKADASWEHGLDVRDTYSDIESYVAKFGRLPKDLENPYGWTISHEVAKAVSKKAHAEGRTPLSLLAASAAGDKWAGMLFHEYSRAFKGKKQLIWSSGLRKLLGLDIEKTDECLAAQSIDDSSVLLSMLDFDDWRLVLANDARYELWAAACSGNPDDVRAFLDGLRGR